MQSAGLDELARDPVGRYVSGERFVHFCASEKLWGVVLWGRPTEADALELGRSLVLELDPPAIPHASVIDARRLEGGEARAFLAAQRYLEKYWTKLSIAVTRLALIRPSGIGGAIVAGAYEVLPKPYPVSVFEDPALAISWLGADAGHPDASRVATAIESLYGEATGTPALVLALSAHVESHLQTTTLAEAAVALGMSERSLQRKLSDAATSFQDEVARARVRVAKRMLLDSDAPLTTIAFDVGCASLQHFSTLFRKQTGESPTTWRRKQIGD